MQRIAPKNVQMTVMVAGISALYGSCQIWLSPVYKAPIAGRTMMVRYLRMSYARLLKGFMFLLLSPPGRISLRGINVSVYQTFINGVIRSGVMYPVTDVICIMRSRGL